MHAFKLREIYYRYRYRYRSEESFPQSTRRREIGFCWFLSSSLAIPSSSRRRRRRGCSTCRYSRRQVLRRGATGRFVDARPCTSWIDDLAGLGGDVICTVAMDRLVLALAARCDRHRSSIDGACGRVYARALFARREGRL